jgi:hypothetical protein
VGCRRRGPQARRVRQRNPRISRQSVKDSEPKPARSSRPGRYFLNASL